MSSIYSPNDSESHKNMARSYSYKIPCQRSLFNISAEKLEFK